MRQLVEAETAARQALNLARINATSAEELARLWLVWTAANDALADAIAGKKTKEL